MKTLRYLLMICTLTMTAAGYSQAQFKTSEDKQAFEYIDATEPYEFQSTSTMSGSGSNLPIAARNGTTLDSYDETQTSPRPHKAPPIIGGDDMPVGEGMWALLLMAAGYVGWMMRRRKCTM